MNRKKKIMSNVIQFNSNEYLKLKHKTLLMFDELVDVSFDKLEYELEKNSKQYKTAHIILFTQFVELEKLLNIEHQTTLDY